MKQMFYVLDKDSIYMVPHNGAINKINANKRIRIASKLCNNPIFARFIFNCFNVCLFMLVCDYLPMCILVGFGAKGVFWSFF